MLTASLSASAGVCAFTMLWRSGLTGGPARWDETADPDSAAPGENGLNPVFCVNRAVRNRGRLLVRTLTFNILSIMFSGQQGRDLVGNYGLC